MAKYKIQQTKMYGRSGKNEFVNGFLLKCNVNYCCFVITRNYHCTYNFKQLKKNICSSTMKI